jgi:dTMP kinase
MHLTKFSSAGRFISLEGIDGAGKSTQLQWIRTLIEQAGHKVVCTREPGGTLLGERIRDLLLHFHYNFTTHFSELFLLAAARVEHIEQIIRPALTRGEWVLCDRFNDATYAYQGNGRGLPWTAIETVEQLVQNKLQPDLTILFDVNPEIARARCTTQDRFESEALDFFRSVREGYLARAKLHPQRIRIVNAQASPQQVQDEVTHIINQYLAVG